uniref:xanthine dehydrogenase family protein molybdopterin-binding subunit n=1 Tax=Nonomuraea bangladeshensis TaxID=404385 RepID=UPI003F490BDA
MTTLARGVRRPDGPAKLTGKARYAADTPHPDALVAVVVTSTIARGTLTGIDIEEALQAPGVTRVLTQEDMPRLAPMPSPPLGHTLLPMQDNTIHYEGQPIAIVLAQELEQAQHAAQLVRAHYADVKEPVGFGQGEEIRAASPHMLREQADEAIGDAEAAIADADVQVTAQYTTSDRHHNPIEPSSTLAWWEDDQLVLHSSVQGITLTQQVMAVLFGLSPERVKVVCPYVGGGFGSKAFLWLHLPLTAMAARACGQAVRLVLTRAQMFTLCGHQPATRQTVSLAATSDGRLTAVRHIGVNATARSADYYVENITQGSRMLYDSPAISVHARVEQGDRPNPTPMRAPNEALGMFALESAMDELAHELGMDPVELRLRNQPSVDPMTGRPFSARPLVACVREGARRFGWSQRPPVGSLREGNELIGWGMASFAMESHRGLSSAKLQAHADGRIVVETGMEEIGTGLPALVQAITSEALGIAPDAVQVRHGDSTLPPHAGSFGDMSAMGLGSAVHVGAAELRAKLEAIGGIDGLRRSGQEMIEVEGRWGPEATAGPTGSSTDYSMHTYGAFFAEVRVDADLGLVRVRRAVGVYGAGRILNPLAARSQMIGGITWGIGQALLEQSILEPGRGRFLHKNLAGYVVPVNADIGDIDVAFIDEPDPHASATGAKGVGELGACGVAAAIANAVFHATGRRVRSLPIRIHDLL